MIRGLPYLFLLAALVPVRPAAAQLISPGKLTAAHADLEGVTNCTSCHALGQRGIAPAKCLDCHTPLQARIRRDEGFHATVARDCGSCHKEHFGRAFDPVRLDPDRFDHADTGYDLVGDHRGLECQQCHQPRFITDRDVRAFKGRAGRLDRTFLGLADDCQTCHRADNPHGAGFADAECASCHDARGWDRIAPFDHAETGFALVGAHAEATCTACHATDDDGIVFTGLAGTCASCHRAENPHGGQFRGQDCASCHDARAWDVAARFSHDRTAFPLTGRHRGVACGSCHGPVSGQTDFSAPAFDTCASCHADPHGGALGADCATCHATTGWEEMARSFDAGRFDHAAATGFALVGAHGRLDCAACHARPERRDDAIHIVFAAGASGSFPEIVADDCQSCHRDVHDGAFTDLPGGTACASCHGQEDWLPTSFGVERHNAETDFALTGGHLATPCFACHGGGGEGNGGLPHFEFERPTCESCHAGLNPHGEQFADASGTTTCGPCHTTEQWDLAQFDHAATGFPLTGQHAALDCQRCHALGDSDTRTFAGLDATCASCHASDSPHQGQFEGTSCDTCHDTRAFTVAAFDHDQTAFPLDGAHEAVACGSCHRTETAPGGEPFVRFRPLGTACADCHGGRP